MDFEPIEIKIKDTRLMTEIAYAIDRPSFVERANKIRKKYRINNPLKDSNYQDWLIKNIGEKRIPKFYKEITDLRLFLGYDTNYQAIFEKAILGCDIEPEDYHSTHLVNFAKLPSYLKYESPLLFAIIVTPQTDKQDVKKAFKRYKQIEKELQLSPDSYSSTDKRIDDRTQIVRDRKWYWKRDKGIGYRQIAHEDGISDIDYYTQYKAIIRDAIKTYKRKLG